MGGLIEAVTTMLSASERRLETISNNIANVSTPGFKRQLDVLTAATTQSHGSSSAPLARLWSDLTQGKMDRTGNSLDLAISGAGFFQLRAGEQTVYSRQGQFRLAEDGTVATPQGHRLQQAGGGDLVLDRAAVEILADGTVLDEGRPVGRIALYAPTDADALESSGGSMFAAAGGRVEEVSAPDIRQGMVEASNTVLGEEMVAMMATLRQAESGSRLAQTYDELLGRAISTFGQGGR
jgi:flagellar basal-body rod protein FlgG